MGLGDTWQVVNTGYLRVRSGAGVGFPSTGMLNGGQQVNEFDRSTVGGVLWIKHQTGWSATQSMGTTYMKCVWTVPDNAVDIPVDPPPYQPDPYDPPPPPYDPYEPTPPPYNPTPTPNPTPEPQPQPKPPRPKPDPYDDNKGAGYRPNVNSIFGLGFTNNSVSNSEFVKIKNVAGVFGLPYQFLPNTDVRLSGDTKTENIGFEYADKIVKRIPLMFLSPGKASFMTRFSKSERESILSKIIGGNKGNLEDLLSNSGKYYTFEPTRKEYYQYVNPMCRIAARFLNIQDITFNGTKLDRMNWEFVSCKGISSIGEMGDYGAIPFYLDTETSISEAFSNSTTQSTLSSTVNSISDMGRELNFLLGYGVGVDTDRILQDQELKDNLENVDDLIGRLLGNGSFLTNLSSHLTTVASGGKLIFPEIWNDSSFSRNYSCEFKFISPDPSKLSVYLNVLVPLFHLLGLVAPQSVKDNPNGYKNPFLIRAVYKGFFNVDMGIITDMTVTKGAECQWTPEGIPTSINVSISIKDLYSAMSITKTDAFDWSYDTMNNTALMDYIANLCGINIFKPEIGRMIDMWFVNNFTNRIEDAIETNIWTGMMDKIQNAIINIFR